MNDPWPAEVLAWFRRDTRRGDVALALITAVVGTLLIVGSADGYEPGGREVASGVAVFVILLFRRRAPVPLLVATLCIFVAYAFSFERPSPLIFAILVLLVTTCVRLERMRAIGVGLVVGTALYLLSLLINETNYADARAVIAIAWTAGAVGIADAIRSWRQYTVSAEAQVRSAVLAAESQARHLVSEERLEIARELHDLLAHNLSVMNVQAGAALHLLRSDPDKAERSLVTARNAGRSVLDELSEVLAVLRRAEDGEPTGSLPTIDEVDALVDNMRSAGLTVTWTDGGTRRPVAPATSLAAYRITQEALTNAAKHGDGSADLSTEWTDDGFTIRVWNAARRSEAVSNGLGLIGMRERTIANGGRFSAESIGDRFELEVWLPAAALGESTP